jgi:PHP family Zn ribbon phosphoesterase
MNHRLSRLDGITLISNSDAHSVENLAREANVLGFESEKEITYTEITRIIKEGDRKKFLYTIEFYPEEGKYHMDGHADCTVCLKPEASKKEKNSCPVCKKQLTIGVLHRVDDLADRTEESIPNEQFIPHRYIVPLREIIGQVFERDIAHDLTQETFLKTWKQISDGTKIDNIKAWLYRVAQNLVIDYVRKKKDSSLEELQADGFNPDR